jgi:hypothetical protein
VADFPATWTAQELHLSHAERREVVVEHEAPLRFPLQPIENLRILGGPSVVVTSAWVSPRVNRADRACGGEPRRRK